MSYKRHCDFPDHKHMMEAGPYLSIRISDGKSAAPHSFSEFCGESVRDNLDAILELLRQAIRDERHIDVKWEMNWQQVPNVGVGTNSAPGWWDIKQDTPIPTT